MTEASGITEGTRVRVSAKGRKFQGLVVEVLLSGTIVNKQPINEPHVRGIKKMADSDGYDPSRRFTVPVSMVSIEEERGAAE